MTASLYLTVHISTELFILIHKSSYVQIKLFHIHAIWQTKD